MQLLGLLKLEDFKRKHAASRGQLDAWRSYVETAQWSGPQDIKRWSAMASFLADNRVIFNIKGNSYRLVVKVRFESGVVLIEWIGTHAEYSKQDFNLRRK
jgi:mRNA interferase HigB